MKRAIYFICSLSLVMLFLACVLDQNVTKPTGSQGSIIAQPQWPDDLSIELMTVRMTVFSPDKEPKVKYFRFSGDPQMIFGIHGVPAGENCEVIIEGLNDRSNRLYTGSATGITVIPNEVVNSGVIVMESVGRKSAGISIRSPSKVIAIPGDGRITLKWTPVSNAQSYSIYMNKGPGASKRNFDARKATQGNTYLWEELVNGKTYYFVVTAETGDSESKESSEISTRPEAKTVVEKVPAKSAKHVQIKESKKPIEISAGAAATQVVGKASIENKKSAPVKKKQEKKAIEAVKIQSEPKQEPEAVAKAALPLEKMTPQKILEEIDLVKAPNQNFAVDMTITFKSGNNESVNEVSLRVRDFSKSLVIYKYPPTQKGRVLLMVDSNMWIYFPGTKRAIRISPQQQLLGQVSNADVARAVFNLDYSAEKVEEEVVDNETMLRMTLKAKTEGAAYGNIQIWIKRDGFRPTKAEFYTLTGRLLKTIYYKKYQNILGRQRPTLYEVHDAIKKSDISTMEYKKWKIEDTPDSYFQKTFLQRVGNLN